MKRRRPSTTKQLICCALALVAVAPGDAWVSPSGRSSLSRVPPTSLCAKESKELREEKSPEGDNKSLLGRFFSSRRKTNEKPERTKKEEKEGGGFLSIFSSDKKDEEPTVKEEEKGGFPFFRQKEDPKPEIQEEKGPFSFLSSSGKEEKEGPPEESQEGGFFNFRRGKEVDDEDENSKDDSNSKRERRQKKTERPREPKPEKPPKKTRAQKKKVREEQKTESKDQGKSTPSAFSKFMSNTFSNSGDRKAEEWVPVFPKTRLSPGEIVPATVGGIDLLVIASKDGRKLYCIANSCPHLGTPLETGSIVRLPVEEQSESSETSSKKDGVRFTETEITSILQQDGCEDCIVCPLHRTAFALESGQVRGEWCPYPPVVGKIVGTVKPKTAVAIFDIRTKGKQIEVRINTPLGDVAK